MTTNHRSTPLWDKGEPLDRLVQRFCIGDDPYWDLQLLPWDCIASAAHARTLHRAALLSDTDLAALLGGLRDIYDHARKGEFTIDPEHEDCHTAIEAWLTQHVGDPGQKIHTGRSRNDQVAAAMRLFLRDAALRWSATLSHFVEGLLVRIESDGRHPMPGYTHMQPAMPSSVGMWLHASVEAGLEQLRAIADLLERLDRCPLGTGAGFGVPLPLDRTYTAELLGFGAVDRSPIHVQNNRGRLETYFVRVGVDIAALLEKLSWDLILFSTAEYGFFSLPTAMTTGSSIMPQKRNPDVLELMRGRAARMRGRLVELEGIAAKLPSSYHRDLQLTKEPALRTAGEIEEMLRVMRHVIADLTIHPAALAGRMSPELFATDAAYALVRQGVPFREAYRRIADQITRGEFHAGSSAAGPPAATQAESHPARTGMITPELLHDLRDELNRRTRVFRKLHTELAGTYASTLGHPAPQESSL